MKKSEAIGRRVYYLNKRNPPATIKEVRKLKNYDKKGSDMFICYLDNGTVANSVLFYLAEDNSRLVIEDD